MPHPSAASGVGLGQAENWERTEFIPGAEGSSIPYLLGYFTMLYGLYPINFLDYVRKPQRYLRHAQVANAEDVEVQPSEIRDRSEQFRRLHLLHPNFYTMTIDSEKTDFGRWMRSEAADVVEECMALCVAAEGTQALHADGIAISFSPIEAGDGDREEHVPALLSDSITAQHPSVQDPRVSIGTPSSPSSGRVHSALMRRSSQSSHPSLRDSLDTRSREVGSDSPTLPPTIPQSTSHTDLQDMINSNKAIKSGFRQTLANDSVPSLALSHQESIPDRLSAQQSGPLQLGPSPSPAAVAEPSEQLLELRQQVLLLKNDLNFERYMKQQHIAHVGALKRSLVREAATEAELQTLLQTNRNLRHRLEEAKNAEMKVKKESENRRTLAKRWETDLATKLKILREEQKKWGAESAGLKQDLEAAKQESEKLRKLLCEAEVKELNSKQIMQSIETNADEVERLKGEVERLLKVEHETMSVKRKQEMARTDATESHHMAEVLRMRLDAREAELQQTKDYYESQVVVLGAKLADALRANRRASTGSDVNSMVESALAASRAKQLELQKQHSLLMRKYTVLQSGMLDMSVASAGHHEAQISSSGDTDGSGFGGISPVVSRTRTHRGFSDPEILDGVSYNPTPPLDIIGSANSAGTTIHRPSTPSGQLRENAPAGGNTSPQSERYFGRGKSLNAHCRVIVKED